MAASDIITGSGTLWSTEVLRGDTLEAVGIQVTIDEVISDTSLRLTIPWPGPNLDGKPYYIRKNSELRHTATELTGRVRDLLNRLRPFDAAAPVFSILAFGVNSPPVALEGDRFVSGVSPTDQWTGHPNEIIEKTATGWLFRSPEHGWHIIDEATNTVRAWTGSSWTGQIGLGAALIYAGAWSSSESYTPGNIVTHLDRAWAAVNANSNSEPSFDSDDWLLFLNVGEDGGPFTLRYQFDSGTADTAPAPGRIKFNAAPGSATIMRVAVADVHGNDWTSLIGSIDTAATSILKGKVALRTKGDPTRALIASVTAAALVGSTHYNLTISSPQLSAASLQDGADIVFQFQERGDKGNKGDDGDPGPRGTAGGAASISYLFSTTTSAGDPGNGRLRLNNATQSSATAIYADLLNNSSDSVSGLLDSIQGTSDIKATGRIFNATGAKWITFSIMGVTMQSGYRSIAIAVTGSSASSPFTNNEALFFDWSKAGDKGDIGVGEQGLKGDTGQGIQPDATVATISGRDAFDGEADNFIVLVVEEVALYVRDGAPGNWLGPIALGQSAAVPSGHIHGLTIASSGGANLSVAAGECASEASPAELNSLPVGLSGVSMSAAFNEMNGGGLAAGESLPASGTIHLWLIGGDDKEAKLLGNNHATSGLNPTLPSGFTRKRRIGSRRTNASANIIPMLQLGDLCLYDTGGFALDVDVVNPGTSPVLRALLTPAGISVIAHLNARAVQGSASGRVLLSSPLAAAHTPSASAWPLVTIELGSVTAGLACDVVTNTASQIRTQNTNSDGGVGLRIATLGWTDHRGKQ